MRILTLLPTCCENIVNRSMSAPKYFDSAFPFLFRIPFFFLFLLFHECFLSLHICAHLRAIYFLLASYLPPLDFGSVRMI